MKRLVILLALGLSACAQPSPEAASQLESVSSETCREIAKEWTLQGWSALDLRRLSSVEFRSREYLMTDECRETLLDY